MLINKINLILLSVSSFAGFNGINYLIFSIFFKRIFILNNILLILLMALIILVSIIPSINSFMFLIPIYKIAYVYCVYLFAKKTDFNFKLYRYIILTHLIGLIYSFYFRSEEFLFSGFFREQSYFFQSLFIFICLFYNRSEYLFLVVFYSGLAILSGSSIGIILIPLLFFFGFIKYFSNKIFLLMFILFICLHIGSLIFWEIIFGNYYQHLYELGGTRLLRILKGLYMLENGIWGIGLGLAELTPIQVKEYAMDFVNHSIADLAINAAPVANGLLWIMVETGWFSIVFMITFLIWTIKCIKRGKKLVGIVVIGVLCAVFFDSNFLRPEFALALGIATSEPQKEKIL